MIRAADVALELARQAIPPARTTYARGRWWWEWPGTCVVLEGGVVRWRGRGLYARTLPGIQALVAGVAELLRRPQGRRS